jgi:hypothetical protein
MAAAKKKNSAKKKRFDASQIANLTPETKASDVPQSVLRKYKAEKYIALMPDGSARCQAIRGGTIAQCENRALSNGFCRKHLNNARSISAKQRNPKSSRPIEYTATKSDFMSRVAMFQKNREITTKNDEELAIQKINIYKFIEEIERFEQIDAELIERFKENMEQQFFSEPEIDEETGEEKPRNLSPLPLEWPETAWLKFGPQLSSMLEAYNRMKQRQHEILYGKQVTFRVEIVEMIFNRFEFLVKDICANDITKLEKFAIGLRQMGSELVTTDANKQHS